MATTRPLRFTGRHMAVILVSFFGVVIAVNLMMARLAIGTFGGTVVDNSYVASQNFNTWLAEARSEQTLDWHVAVTRGAAGTIAVTVLGRDGQPLGGASISAVARHPLGRRPEQLLAFVSGDGGFRSTTRLADGRWQLLVTVVHEGQRMRVAADLE